jgi:anti-sigma factor ChrR (cupin superfamily)
MKFDEKLSDAKELAAFYAAGVLPPDEAAAIESRLDVGDRLLADEIASYGSVLTALAEEAEPVAPSPTTRQRLLEQIAGTRPGGEQQASGNDRAEETPAGIVIRRSELRNWVETGIPGIQECLLHQDLLQKVQTRLIRLAPGTTIPAHPHPGVEECFLLEGDIHTYGRHLHAGDYMVAPPGTFHPPCRTTNGCVMLVRVMRNAELPA